MEWCKELQPGLPSWIKQSRLIKHREFKNRHWCFCFFLRNWTAPTYALPTCCFFKILFLLKQEQKIKQQNVQVPFQNVNQSTYCNCNDVKLRGLLTDTLPCLLCALSFVQCLLLCFVHLRSKSFQLTLTKATLIIHSWRFYNT